AADGEWLSLPQPIAAVIDRRQTARLCLLAGADTGANTAYAPLEYFAWHHIERDCHFVSGFDVAEGALCHVGVDPKVVNSDQRHQSRPGLCVLPNIGTQVGDR